MGGDFLPISPGSIALPYLCFASFGLDQHVVVAPGIDRLYLLQATGGQQQRSQGLLRVAAAQGLVDQPNTEDL